MAKLTPVLDTDFVLTANEDGYGFYREDSWILAYPDAKTCQIVVSKRVDGRTYKTRINTYMTTARLSPNPEGELRSEIIEFLALAILTEKPIDW